jgi:DNA gyrase subunit B
MSDQINASQSNYQASDITVLEGLEAVRKRPSMYIGNTGSQGRHRAVGEILDNSVDEFMAGHGDTIKVVIDNKHDYVMISDNGRGMPTDLHPKTGKSTVETIMTVLHAGGKFNQKSYQFSGGLHGVGASVVNALSEKMEVWVLRNNEIHYIQFSKGKTILPLKMYSVEEAYSKFPQLISNVVWNETGTVVAFELDKTIFETNEYSFKEIEETLKQTAYLNKNLRIIFQTDESKSVSPLEVETEINNLPDQEILDMLMS